LISLVIESAGRVQRLDVPLLPAVVGRAESAEIYLDNERASRHHARFYECDGQVMLEDLESRNGTTLNGQTVTRASLRVGDVLEIGDVRLTVSSLRATESFPPLPGYVPDRPMAGSVDSVYWRARQVAMGRDVTIRVLRESWWNDAAVVAHFQRCARGQGRLIFPWAVSVLDTVMAKDAPCAILEALDGEFLASRLERGAPLTRLEGLRIVEALLEQTVDLHSQGLLHGLLHPGRVLLLPDGKQKLTDIGFPLVSLRQWPEGPAPALAYLAPESSHRPEEAGVRGDLFQVGAVAFRLLTGHPLRKGHDRDELLAEMNEPPELGTVEADPTLRRFLSQMLAMDPAARFDSAASALTAFRTLNRRGAPMAAVAGVDGEAAPTPERKRRLSPRFIMVNRLITVGLMIILNVGVFLWWSSPKKKKRAEIRPAPEEVYREEDSTIPSPEVRPELPPDAVALERAALWKRVEASVERSLKLGEFEAALAELHQFAKYHLGSPEGGFALVRSDVVRRDLETYATDLASAIESALASGDRRTARKLRRDLGARAELLPEGRRAALEEALKAPDPASPRPGTAETPPPPEGVTPPLPVKGGDPPAGLEAVSLNDQASELFRRPLDAAVRTKLLAEAEEGAIEPPRKRALLALEQGYAKILIDLQTLVGQEVTIGGPGSEGEPMKLLSVHPDHLVVAFSGGEAKVPMNRIDPRAILRQVNPPSASLDQYLFRAALHLAAGQDSEAWFDFQGALLLSGEDGDAAAWVREQCEHLARKHRKGQ
jgi:hypothetical protein